MHFTVFFWPIKCLRINTIISIKTVAIIKKICSVMSKSLQPYGYSLAGSSVHGISQARILEWVVISSYRGSSQPRDWTHISCISCIAGGFFTGWAINSDTNIATWLKTAVSVNSIVLMNGLYQQVFISRYFSLPPSFPPHVWRTGNHSTHILISSATQIHIHTLIPPTRPQTVIVKNTLELG